MEYSSRRKRAAALLTGGALATTLPASGRLHADNLYYFGSGPANSDGLEVSVGNNASHGRSYWAATTAWRDALDNAIADSYADTSLSFPLKANSVNADVRVVVGTLNTPFAGGVSCPSDAVRGGTDPNEWCFNQWLKINTNHPNQATNSQQRKSIMCHEFGHTLGFSHPDRYSGTCLHLDPWLVTTTIKQAEKDQLDDYYT